MVKTDDTVDPTDDRIMLPTMDPQEINDLLKDQVRNIGVTVIGVMAAATALATAREIIVNNTNPLNR